MSRTLPVVIAACALCMSCSAQSAEPLPAPTGPAVTHPFDAGTTGAPPAGFRFGLTGQGAEGHWEVIDDSTQAGNRVLAQLDPDDTDFRFPIAVAEAPSMRDGRVSVRCRAVSGQVDQACGLVARYRDDSDYYVTRANALEGNIRLYTVKDGKRRQIASWSGTVTASDWHRLQLDLLGDHLQVSWDGAVVIDHHDTTFAEAGLVDEAWPVSRFAVSRFLLYIYIQRACRDKGGFFVITITRWHIRRRI